MSRIDGTGTKTVLSGDPSARNTLAAPDTVVPVTQQITGVGQSTRDINTGQLGDGAATDRPVGDSLRTLRARSTAVWKAGGAGARIITG